MQGRLRNISSQALVELLQKSVFYEIESIKSSSLKLRLAGQPT